MKKVKQSEITKLRSKIEKLRYTHDNLMDLRDRGYPVSMDEIFPLRKMIAELEDCI